MTEMTKTDKVVKMLHWN